MESRCHTGVFKISERAEQGHVVGDGARDEHRALRQPGQLAPPRGRFEVGNLDSGHRHTTIAGRGDPGDDLQSGAFSCAVRTGEYRYPARLEHGAEVMRAEPVATRDAEVVENNHGTW